jgi:C_GCAxxG_C_C family probable redox protein
MESKPSKEDVLNNLDQKVDEYFRASGNCAQASFLALQEQFGFDGGPIFKALTPFPGLAFRGQVCGVVVACVLVLGLKYGRETIDDRAGYIRSIPPVKAFYQRFEKKVGSILCPEVVESVAGDTFESTEPAETKKWLDAGCIDKCMDVLITGVRITAEILMDKKHNK